MMSQGCSSWDFDCEACGKSFTKTSPYFDGLDTALITNGAKFCYSGHHTVTPLKNTDQRRVRDDVLVLNAGPNLQQKEIDAIPSMNPNISVLTIKSSGCCDNRFISKLEISMPQLETLKLIDVAFSTITLNTELTPKIHELYMQNIPDKCNLTVLLPELKTFSMHYYDGIYGSGCDWVHNMLSTSTKLRSFDTYKFGVGPELHFAGIDLEYICLRRAELLSNLSIYAPKLRELSLQGCYGLDGTLTILESHPDLPCPSSQPSTFLVNTINAIISPTIASTLQNNPRVMWDDDDIVLTSGNPMEGMFAQMHSNARF